MLHLQDSAFSRSYSTHEALIDSCRDSVSGYGAFAFASATGVELLLKDTAFDALLERGFYSLVLGIDEITNIASLESLRRIQESRPSLEVRAFLHNRPSLFHPKFTFFKSASESGSLVIGSGNLTLGGLRKNYEGFAVVNLDRDQTNAVESYWLSWLDESRERLKPINDELVLNKVKQNHAARYSKEPGKLEHEGRGQEKEATFSAKDLDFEWKFASSDRVLLAEIPRSGNRWKQANFDVETFREFFGATPGDNSQRILLRHVNNDGAMADIEIRQSVSVRSQNYRFELEAASGIDYPRIGKPIGIFIRLSTRVFLYHLFIPGEAAYEELSRWMDRNWDGRLGRMKRIVCQASDVDEIMRETVFARYRGW